MLLFPLKGQEDSSRGSDNSSYDEALSPTSPGPLSVRAGHGERDLGNTITAPPTPELHGINPVFLSSNPSRWSVEEVYEFIASLQGTGSGSGGVRWGGRVGWGGGVVFGGVSNRTRPTFSYSVAH